MIQLAIVEDDDELREDIAFNLNDEGFQVHACANATALDVALNESAIDVVVLDIGLPGEDGLSIARRLRRRWPQLGIVMLTARTARAERIEGLEEGADAYLGKPADMRELALVIRALARRVSPVGPGVAGLTLDASAQRLHLQDGARLELTPSECQILARLARAPRQQANRNQLIEALGGDRYDYDERRLEALISRLRRKLTSAGLDASVLVAERGVGYEFRLPLAHRDHLNT
jgi:DNA-binding response OmpR family regulator